MKAFAQFFVAIFLVATAIAYVESTPPKPPAPDFVVIKEKAGELKDLIVKTLKDIEANVTAAAPEVGKKVKKELDAFISTAETKVNEFLTSTNPKAKEFFEGLMKKVEEAKEKVKADVDKLAPEVKKSIKAGFEQAVAKAQEIIKEIASKTEKKA